MRRRWLVPFPLLAGWIGCSYIFGDPARTATPSFEVPRSLAAQVGAAMPLWGALFVVGALVMVTAMGTSTDEMMYLSLTIGGFVYAWWSSLFLASALTDPHASLTGWAIHGFIAYAHFATAHFIKLRRAR